MMMMMIITIILIITIVITTTITITIIIITTITTIRYCQAHDDHDPLQDEPYLVTCPQHAASYVDRSQPGGTDAPRNPEQGYNRGSDMGDYEDQEMPNGDVPRHRALDRSGGNGNLVLAWYANSVKNTHDLTQCESDQHWFAASWFPT